jgi:hypothetical protein
MPAIPARRSNKPFKPQSELKRKRTHARLRVYAKRRNQYNASAALVLCMFIVHFLPQIREWRKQQQRIAARPGNKLRQRRHRKLQRILLRIAKLEMKRTELRAEIVTVEERVRVEAWQARKHATAQNGFAMGWSATSPVTEAELKAQSYAKRFITAYLGAVAERKRVEAVMAKQSTPTVQPATITL